MSVYPIACNLEGDYGYKVIVVDKSDTVTEVIRKTTEQIVGVLVKPFPKGTILRARIHGADEPLAGDAVIGDLGIVQMEAIDIYAEA
jgi:hypothetical protein